MVIIFRKLSEKIHGSNKKDDSLMSLTKRERDVFDLLLEGWSLKDTAEKLGIKYSTANSHMTSIYRKLNVKSRIELIINYQKYKEEKR